MRKVTLPLGFLGICLFVGIQANTVGAQQPFGTIHGFQRKNGQLDQQSKGTEEAVARAVGYAARFAASEQGRPVIAKTSGAVKSATTKVGKAFYAILIAVGAGIVELFFVRKPKQ